MKLYPVRLNSAEAAPDVVSHRRLTVKHKRTLQLEEDVLCVKFSPDHRLLAVSLLDCTVKLFYTDTLKVASHSLTRPLDPAARSHTYV